MFTEFGDFASLSHKIHISFFKQEEEPITVNSA